MNRTLPIAAACLLLTGCGGIKKYLPAGPVLSASERDAWGEGPSGAAYTDEARVPFPVLPVQVWGVTYDLDLVLESEHDRYDMHEYARVITQEGPVWMAKDALSASKTQSIIASLDNLASWVPEMPVTRKSSELKIQDRSTGDWLDLTIEYENLEGEQTVVTYEGAPPTSPQKKRNGNTMGHSANVAMAVLDIPYQDFGKRASVQIDGADYKIRKLLGLVKLQVALIQTQGGLSINRFDQRAAGDTFKTSGELAGVAIEQDWELLEVAGKLEARQNDGFRTLSYTFDKVDDGASLELSRLNVYQFGFDEPLVTIVLNPSLPDLRRKFEGRHTSRFVVDVNDQRGHAFGRLEAFWEGDEAKVLLLPEEPEWVTDRPMATTIRYREEAAPAPVAEAVTAPREDGADDDTVSAPRTGAEDESVAVAADDADTVREKAEDDALPEPAPSDPTPVVVAEVEIVRVPVAID